VIIIRGRQQVTDPLNDLNLPFGNEVTDANNLAKGSKCDFKE
jgi:hypothetical protein